MKQIISSVFAFVVPFGMPNNWNDVEKFFAAIVLSAILSVVGRLMFRRAGTHATGELCFETAYFRCTVCGEVVGVERGEHFPQCDEGDVHWEKTSEPASK